MTRKQYLIRNEIAKMDGENKVHFLNPQARRRNKSLGDAAGLVALGVHLIEIPIGSTASEFHYHLYEEECLFILDGSGVARIGEAVYQVEAGDFIGYPAGGEPHDLRNTGAGLLRCLVVGQRLPFDVATYPEKGKRLYRMAGQPWDMADITAIEHPAPRGRR